MKIESIKALTCKDIDSNREEYYKIGIEEIKRESVGVVILSGGQGSRLGFSHAKGMYNVGETKDVYLFELLIKNLLKIVKECGHFIPLFIMTSEKNNDEIIDFFKEHHNFGYDDAYINFFKQFELPALNLDGSVFHDKNGKQVLLPSGNGDWYKKLKLSNLLDKYPSIEWLNCVSVDNPLQIMADPVFIGATIKNNNLIGAKVIEKAYKDEKVGVICRIDDKPSILEYIVAPDWVKDAKDENGDYIYKYGVILNYLFNKKVLDKNNEKELKKYEVKKNVDVNGEIIPLIKIETLIVDTISFFDNVCVYEVERNKEFAPIKNKDGKDSVESARLLLKENGISL